MNTLSLAIYLEGNSDRDVLPILVQRITQELLDQEGWEERGWSGADVLPPTVLNPIIEDTPPDLASRLLAAARFADGYHLMILHRDADAPKTNKARQKVDRARKKYEQAKANGEPVCEILVLLIPIREMEAWLLADASAILHVLGQPLTTSRFDLQKSPHEIESCNAKQALNQVVQSVLPGTDLNNIYTPLAETLSLTALKPLRGYQEFVNELEAALFQLNIIKPK